MCVCVCVHIYIYIDICGGVVPIEVDENVDAVLIHQRRHLHVREHVHLFGLATSGDCLAQKAALLTRR